MTSPSREQRALRTCLGQFASGVTVVTTSDGVSVHGATVSSFASVSLDPPLVLVSLDRRSRVCQRLGAGGPFGVNVLAAGQRELALHFAGVPDARLAEVRWEGDPEAARLAGAVAYFSCRPWAAYPGGDHVLHLGEVVRFDAPGGDPLVFHSGVLSPHRRPADGIAWTGSLDGPAHGWAHHFGVPPAAGSHA
ncbi:flavin reductase family protein [Streptomyces sp. LP05-1]|uniref:Flavin reductase family protein n=1 Tax=Streptomyces pyxinae TaxID=2970734 RepID=A0ABT2CK58_9ACTN|nr:flavin reductase family protein [Streptomyces sp. LP05-1]MCS0637814.1 flavin reductase family protein [Streptomyces sp. LP05-1]